VSAPIRSRPACGGLSPGVAVRVKPPGALMHLKSYCVDGRTLRSGAANFSWSGEDAQDNDLVIVRSPGACAASRRNSRATGRRRRRETQKGPAVPRGSGGALTETSMR
jgi:phosphatidylserine/phosphatidylglycerophosphate/cardiolipin synthase-like enzyme